MRGALLLILASLVLAGCGQIPEGVADTRARQERPGERPGCVERFDPGADYFPVKATVRHAANFSVRYERHFKVVRVRAREEHGGSDETQTLVLVQCGTPAPRLEGELAGATLVEVPARTVAVGAPSDAARLRALGLADRIVALGNEKIHDPELRRRWEAGELATIGDASHGPPSYEKLLELQPDLALLFATSAERSEGIRRLRELGIAAVPSFAWSEADYLGQAEWVKYAALFFNAEAAAERFFAGVEARYRALSAQARVQAEKPAVFWGGPTDGDRWWVEQSGPEARLLADAGAVNLLADPDAGPWAALDTGALLDRAGDADVWITNAQSAREWNARVPLDRLRPYREGRVYHYHRRSNPATGTYDWNETALVRPDQVLADLVALFHPALMPGHEPVFFARLEKGGAH